MNRDEQGHADAEASAAGDTEAQQLRDKVIQDSREVDPYPGDEEEDEDEAAGADRGSSSEGHEAGFPSSDVTHFEIKGEGRSAEQSVPFGCVHCDKICENQAEAIAHVETHGAAGRRAYRCTTCNRCFDRPASLQEHFVDDHLRLKRFGCSGCDERFVRLVDVQVHIDDVHNALKRHRCSQCNKTFGRAGDLRLHVRTVHDGVRPFKCTVCNMQFGYKNNLKKHIDTVHNGIKRFQCEVCGKRFGRKDHLHRHSENKVCIDERKRKLQASQDEASAFPQGPATTAPALRGHLMPPVPLHQPFPGGVPLGFVPPGPQAYYHMVPTMHMGGNMVQHGLPFVPPQLQPAQPRNEQDVSAQQQQSQQQGGDSSRPQDSQQQLARVEQPRGPSAVQQQHQQQPPPMHAPHGMIPFLGPYFGYPPAGYIANPNGPGPRGHLPFFQHQPSQQEPSVQPGPNGMPQYMSAPAGFFAPPGTFYGMPPPAGGVAGPPQQFAAHQAPSQHGGANGAPAQMNLPLGPGDAQQDAHRAAQRSAPGPGPANNNSNNGAPSPPTSVSARSAPGHEQQQEPGPRAEALQPSHQHQSGQPRT